MWFHTVFDNFRTWHKQPNQHTKKNPFLYYQDSNIQINISNFICQPFLKEIQWNIFNMIQESFPCSECPLHWSVGLFIII